MRATARITSKCVNLERSLWAVAYRPGTVPCQSPVQVAQGIKSAIDEYLQHRRDKFLVAPGYLQKNVEVAERRLELRNWRIDGDCSRGGDGCIAGRPQHPVVH